MLNFKLTQVIKKKRITRHFIVHLQMTLTQNKIIFF